MTRGRTGSTSVINELDKLNNVTALQELFIAFQNFSVETIDDWYNVVPPYEYWLNNNYRKTWYAYFCKESNTDNLFAARKYLKHAEKIAEKMNSDCLGFKVLSHHFVERPYLYALIKERAYKIIYLRRNVARQVISGMIAQIRGHYNSLADYIDDNQYESNISLFKELVSWEKKCVESDLLSLAKDKDAFLTVSYEDYCDNKILFYNEMSNFLNCKLAIPLTSSTQVMLPNIEKTLKNYNDVKEAAYDSGYKL